MNEQEPSEPKPLNWPLVIATFLACMVAAGTIGVLLGMLWVDLQH